MKITFKKLCDLVANIDPVFNGSVEGSSSSYPLNFEVSNGNESENRCFQCGIGECDNEEVYDVFQYLAEIDNIDDNIVFNLIDVQYEDMMTYDGICDLLRTKCGITEDSDIDLDEEMSFDGTEVTIRLEDIKPLVDEYGYYEEKKSVEQ